MENTNDLAELLRTQSEHLAPLHGLSDFAIGLKRETIPAIAASERPALIHGEQSTGKTAIVMEIARSSIPPEPDFRTVDCGLLDEASLEATLFGGGTGRSQEPGLLGEARILCLEALDSCPKRLQDLLYRALRRSEYLTGGIGRPIGVKARVLATASNLASLEADAANAFPHKVHVPPLRQRRADLLPVLMSLRPEGSSWVFPASAIVSMLFSPWHGNFHELRQAAEDSLEIHARSPMYGHGAIQFRYPGLHSFTERNGDCIDSGIPGDIWRHIASLVRRLPSGQELISPSLACELDFDLALQFPEVLFGASRGILPPHLTEYGLCYLALLPVQYWGASTSSEPMNGPRCGGNDGDSAEGSDAVQDPEDDIHHEPNPGLLGLYTDFFRDPSHFLRLTGGFRRLYRDLTGDGPELRPDLEAESSTSGHKAPLEGKPNTPSPEATGIAPPGTQWKDVRIKFVNGDTVRIVIKSTQGDSPVYDEKVTSAQIGGSFYNHKSCRGSVQWDLLIEMSETGGTLEIKQKDNLRAISTQVKRINMTLREFFAIEEQAIVLFKDKTERTRTYKPKFTLAPEGEKHPWARSSM
jgi:hypothetical protein